MYVIAIVVIVPVVVVWVKVLALVSSATDVSSTASASAWTDLFCLYRHNRLGSDFIIIVTIVIVAVLRMTRIVLRRSESSPAASAFVFILLSIGILLLASLGFGCTVFCCFLKLKHHMLLDCVQGCGVVSLGSSSHEALLPLFWE